MASITLALHLDGKLSQILKPLLYAMRFQAKSFECAPKTRRVHNIRPEVYVTPLTYLVFDDVYQICLAGWEAAVNLIRSAVSVTWKQWNSCVAG